MATNSIYKEYKEKYKRDIADGVALLSAALAKHNLTDVNPEGLLYAIGAKETLWGTSSFCNPKGVGCVGDQGNGFGIFQVDRRWHPEHINSGAYKDFNLHLQYVIGLLEDNMRMLFEYSNINKTTWVTLKNLICCYNAGIGNVIDALKKGEDPNSRTTGDYYGDVHKHYLFFISTPSYVSLELDFSGLKGLSETQKDDLSYTFDSRLDAETIKNSFKAFLDRASNFFALEDQQVSAILIMRALWSGVSLKEAEQLFIKETEAQFSTPVFVKAKEPFERPVDRQYKISSPYGYRTHPIHGNNTFHNGIDYAAPSGASILAVADGQVTYAGFDAGYGNMVVVFHKEHNLFSIYAHNSRNVAKLKQNVKKGEVIGLVGSTGRSTGAHLHFEFRKATAPTNEQYFKRQVVNPIQINGVFA